MNLQRIFLYPKDIMCITGKSYSTALRLYSRIRQHYAKSANALITIREFCRYMGIDPKDLHLED